ncbi:MAG: hypothetical protein GX589_02465 [Deltaproteobacteria bacterium]|nr:hypothetical protein [Deltaproteobacteria bacterium]
MHEKVVVQLRKTWTWFAGGLILAVYLAVIMALPRGAFYSPDSGGKYLQMLGCHLDGGVQCVPVYPAAVADPDFLFYGHQAEEPTVTVMYPYLSETGEARTGWTPWFPLLTWPFYRVWGVTGLHLIPWMAGLLLIVLAGVVAERLCAGTGPFAAVVVGIGTPVLFYSMCFWEHTLAVALALAALLPWVSPAQNTSTPAICHRHWFVSAALMIAACALRRELIFFLGAGMLTLGWLHPQRRRYLPVMLAILLALGVGGSLLLFVYPASLWWIFPTPLSDMRWLRSLLSADLWQQFPSNIIRVLVLSDFDTQFSKPVLSVAFLGLTLCVLSPLCPIRWRRTMVLLGAAIFSVPAAVMAFTPVRYRYLNSLLLPAPFALLTLLPSGVAASIARRRLECSIILFLAAFYMILPAAAPVHGGIEWGSRYALIVIVLLNVLGVVKITETIIAKQGLTDGARWMVTLLASWLFFLGMVSATRGINELHQTRRNLLTLQSELEQGGDAVVTDSFWLGLSLAPFYARHEVYVLSTAHPLQEWLMRIGAKRYRFTYVGKIAPGEFPDQEAPRWFSQEVPAEIGMPVTRFQRRPHKGNR